jgi:hypothetical protein
MKKTCSVKFKAITSRGDVVKKTVKVELPSDMEERTETLNINGTDISFKITLEDQVMDWLDSIDKSPIMDENDWYTILDYNVVKKATKQTKVKKLEEFKELIKNHFNSEFEHADKLRDDFMVTYIKMFDKIQTLSAKQQFIIVAGTLDTAYTAQSEAYKHAIKLIQSISDKDIAKRVFGSRQKMIE